MKDTIVNLIVVAALSLSFSDAALSAEEPGGKAQPATAPPAASAVPAATVESTPPATVKEPQPATRTTSRKHTRAKAVRPKNLDLRHCLELDNNPAIARCAHE